MTSLSKKTEPSIPLFSLRINGQNLCILYNGDFGVRADSVIKTDVKMLMEVISLIRVTCDFDVFKSIIAPIPNIRLQIDHATFQNKLLEIKNWIKKDLNRARRKLAINHNVMITHQNICRLFWMDFYDNLEKFVQFNPNQREQVIEQLKTEFASARQGFIAEKLRNKTFDLYFLYIPSYKTLAKKRVSKSLVRTCSTAAAIAPKLKDTQFDYDSEQRKCLNEKPHSLDTDKQISDQCDRITMSSKHTTFTDQALKVPGDKQSMTVKDVSKYLGTDLIEEIL